MKALLSDLFDAAVAAVAPANRLAKFLPAPGPGLTLVAGAGKAAVSMAEALTDNYQGPVSGVVVTRYGHVYPRGHEVREPSHRSDVNGIKVLEAAHPVPDEAATTAGHRILELARQAGAGDRFIVLLSGGASALMEYPLPGLTLTDIQTVNRQLLSAGADIAQVNCVRKKLSALKGGRLAVVAEPAEVLLFAISDVPGDDIGDIGSGPCSPDTTSLADAREVLRRYQCSATREIWAALNHPENETPDVDHSAFDRVSGTIIASASDAISAAGKAAAAVGFEPVNLGTDINAPAQALAAEHARLAMSYQRRGGRFALISGGETTVRVANPAGRGGRNTEYLLSLALALNGATGIWALAADTDGIDGTESNAGAVIGPDTLRRAELEGLNAVELMANNLSYNFFTGLDDLLVTGPTRTNVNDLRVILVFE